MVLLGTKVSQTGNIWGFFPEFFLEKKSEGSSTDTAPSPVHISARLRSPDALCCVRDTTFVPRTENYYYYYSCN